MSGWSALIAAARRIQENGDAIFLPLAGIAIKIAGGTEKVQ
jgi:hypothetical protein